MKYTSQDVRDAVYAWKYNRIATTNGGTPAEWIENDCMDGESLPEDLATYQRGAKLLETTVVLSTDDRYDETNGVAFDMAAKKLEERGAESPVVEFYNGYVSTTQMCAVHALKSK